MLERLCDHFAWRTDGDLAAELHSTLADAYCARYERAVQWLQSHDAARAEDLNQRLSCLPDEAFMSLLMAPETGFRLGYDGPARIAETADFLEAALTAEELRLGARDEAPEPTWSARGDRYFPRLGGGKDVAQSPLFDPSSAFAAPEIKGLVVDFHSPRATSRLRHISGDAAPIRPEDLTTALERIAAALDLVERSSEGAWRTVRDFTDVIVVRSDPSAPEHYTSASTTLCLKRPVLRNPFVARATAPELADGLVHEAIHCVCDLAEMRDGRWLEDRAAEDIVKVASPWTGRALDLHTYLQACWVWFGLWCFWLAALEDGALGSDEAARCLARAYRGFHQEAALGRLAPARGRVREDLLDALRMAQDKVLADPDALRAIERRQASA